MNLKVHYSAGFYVALPTYRLYGTGATSAIAAMVSKSVFHIFLVEHRATLERRRGTIPSGANFLEELAHFVGKWPTGTPDFAILKIGDNKVAVVVVLAKLVGLCAYEAILVLNGLVPLEVINPVEAELTEFASCVD
jgi:hypothetical protein